MKNDLVERLERQKHYFLNAIEGEYTANLLGEAIEALSTTPGREEIAEAYRRGILDAAAKAANPGFIQARDSDWDEGVSYAKAYVHDAILQILRKEGA